MKKIDRIIRDLDATIEAAKKTAAVEIYANIDHRVFTAGKDRDGNKIGSYSTTKLPASFFGLEETEYPNGISYKEYRGLKGLKTDFIDLKFTGELQRSITLNDESVYFKNQYGVEIGGYNEVRFGKKIFSPGAVEKKIFIDVLNSELDKLWKSSSV